MKLLNCHNWKKLFFPCLFCCILSFGKLYAQKIPKNHQNKLVRPGLKGMRPKKAIEFQIFDSPGFHRISHFKSSEGSTNNIYAKPDQRIRTKLKLPLWNAKSLKASLGVYYNNEDFSLHNHSNSLEVTELNLKRVKANISVLKLIDYKNYFVVRGEFDVSGDFNGLLRDSEYQNYSVSALWGHQKNENTEFGVGLVYRNGFNGINVLPILMYNHNFSEKWGLEMALPKQINLRHNCSPTSNFNIQSSLRTDRYLIKRPEHKPDVDSIELPYLFNRLEVRTGISFQKEIIPLVWTEISAGFRQDVNLLGNGNYSALSSSEPNSSYFSISFFVTPPSSFRR